MDALIPEFGKLRVSVGWDWLPPNHADTSLPHLDFPSRNSSVLCDWGSQWQSWVMEADWDYGLPPAHVCVLDRVPTQTPSSPGACVLRAHPSHVPSGTSCPCCQGAGLEHQPVVLLIRPPSRRAQRHGFLYSPALPSVTMQEVGVYLTSLWDKGRPSGSECLVGAPGGAHTLPGQQ